MFGWMKKGKDEKSSGGPAVLEGGKDAPEIKVKVLERKGCSVSLSVTVPAGDVDAAIEHAFLDVQRKVKLPGFRPGKAPLETVKKNFREHAVEHGINELLKDTVRLALDGEKIVPLTVPSVDKVDYHEGKPLKYELRVECPPEVALKAVSGLPLLKKTDAVSDADVEKRLEGLRESNSKLIPSSAEAVAESHFVVVDYDAFLDGNPVEGGKAQDQLIEMSAPQSLAGFNDALKGMKKDETKDAVVPFPAEHPSKALAGKDITFRITVKDIKEKSLPAADDEFAKDLGLASLEELRSRLRKGLEKEASRNQREDLEKQVIDALLERHPFDVPPSQVEERARQLTERLKSALLSQGASAADWSANEKKMLEKNRPEAEKHVRLSYLMVEIARKESIEATDADVDAAVAKASQDAPAGKADEMRKWFEDRRENLRAQVQEEKIFDFLIKNAQVTEQAAS